MTQIRVTVSCGSSKGLDDGVYVMLAPLRPGPHKIRLHAYVLAYTFTLDITYNLTVAK